MNLIGKTLGQYQIVEQIGQSDATTVFKAYQSALGRHVAVKTLSTFTPGLADRFRAVAQLDHPNILPIMDLGQQDDLHYIVMKLASGGTLRERLGQALDLAETAQIIAQVASALDHAHGQGILHCDLKPSNILLDEDNWALLSDFVMVADASSGAADYVSPEQGQGLEVDQRSDVYALGAILYHMLTGQPPFQAPTPMAVIVQHVTRALPAPRQINPALPQAVEDVVCKALAKTPDERYASAGEMARALQAAVPVAPAAPGARAGNGRPGKMRLRKLRLRKLRYILVEHFDQDELQTFCFELGINYESLPGEGLANKARETVNYLARHNRLPELLALGRQQRPDISWDAVPAAPDAASSNSLRQTLVERFDEGELRTLYFDLGISYDRLPGEGTDDKARELVLYLARHDRLPELLDLGAQMRPEIPWDSLSVEVQDVSAPPRPTALPDVSGFVGREDELAYFAAKLADSHLAVISGMAGMGKTALAVTLARQLAQPEQVFWHTFHKDEGVEALLYKLAGFLFWRGQEDMWRMLYGVQRGGGQPPLTPVLLDYMCQAVRGQHCLLCLDDWQLVEKDPLLEQLLERLRQPASQGDLSLLIASQSAPDFVRADEFQALAGLSLQDTILLLAQHGLVTDEEQALKAKVHSTSTLLSRQDLMSADIVANLHARTAGNPRFLTLAADALQRTSVPARFIVRVFATPDVERFLMQEVDDNLSEDERAVMSAVAALLGYPGTRYAIEAALDGENARRTLNELAQRHLLDVSEGDEGRQYSMNSVMRHFYYDLLSKRQRRQAHQWLGEYYELEEPDTLKAARHYERAGEVERSAQLASGDVWAFINQGQAHPLRNLLERFKPQQLAPARQARFLLARGEVYGYLQQRDPAHESYEQALSALPAAPDAEQRALTARVYRGLSELTRNESPQTALNWLEKGLAALGDAETEDKAELFVRVSTLQITGGQYDAAQENIARAARLLPPGGSWLRAAVLLNSGIVHQVQGNLPQSIADVEQALHTSRQAHNYVFMLKVWNTLGVSHSLAGNIGPALKAFQEGLELAQRLGNVNAQTLLGLNVGTLQMRQGEYAQALQNLLHSLALAQANNLQRWVLSILPTLAQIYQNQDDTAQAAEALSQAKDLAQQMQIDWIVPRIYYLQALNEIKQHQAHEALGHAEESVQLARDLKRPMDKGTALRVLGQARLANDQAQEALQAFEESLALLQGKDPYEAAHTQMEWGLALVSQGQVEQGASLLQQARATFAEQGAQRDLAVVERALAPL
jgi:ATP/maltotriose-dependent transcriptional regulator MalT